MNLDRIKKILAASDESPDLEFKKSTAQLKAAGETLCAFLNGAGGLVLIGISNSKEIIGQDVTDSTRLEISNTIAKLAPSANIQINYIPTGNQNKQIIALRAISESKLKPYTFDGRAHMRIESATLMMPHDHYQRLSISNAQNNISWEDVPIEDATLDDLDSEEILRTVRIGVANGRIPEDYATNDIKEALKRFKLLNNGKLTRAAIILFAKDPTTWLPQCKIRLARFRGIDKDEFIDNKQFEGNAFRIVDEAMTFALRHLPISSYLPSDSIERVDEPLFPPKILREIFVNAVSHRSYNHPGGSISCGIYDNRLEVWSPGVPPFEIPFEELKNLHESYPRNPHIAKVFYYRKLSETWGKGIELIIDKCIEAGHPEPEFFERTSGFCVRLIPKHPIGDTGIYKIPALPEGVELTPRQKEILLVVQRRGIIKLQDIINKLAKKTPNRTIQRELMRLKDLGLIEKQGVRGGASWKIAKK